MMVEQGLTTDAATRASERLTCATRLAATDRSANDRVGRDYLTRRSWLIKHAGDAVLIADVVIVDDSTLDTERMASSLRLMFGRDVSVRVATTVSGMSALLRDKHPDLLIVDDHLSQGQRAETTLASAGIRGYQGPIFIVTGLLTRQRMVELRKLGAVDVIHKDDLDSTRLREAVLKIVVPSPEAQ
jgi:CheY-like chemotaxis protein